MLQYKQNAPVVYIERMNHEFYISMEYLVFELKMDSNKLRGFYRI